MPYALMPLNAAEAGDLTNLGVVFSQLGDWIIEMLGTITGAPILLIGLGIAVTGGVIGLGHRLIRG